MLMKENKKTRQRNRILSKARSLFWDKGYDKTSMRDIASACDFEPGNIYNYFTNKEQLLFELLLHDHKKVVTPIIQLKDDSSLAPVEKLQSLIKLHIMNSLVYTRSSRLLGDVELRSLSTNHRKQIIKLRDDYDETLLSIIREGKRTGVFVVNDEKMTCLAIASLLVRSRIWYSPKGRLSSNDIADFIFNFILSGLQYAINRKKVD
ncbi:TetR/AcrR family transcriptional regulator [Chloroflexota bacterium]